MSGEKTEKPTAKKRRESRREGQVARTPELGTWFALCVLTWAGPAYLTHLGDLVTTLLRTALNLISDPGALGRTTALDTTTTPGAGQPVAPQVPHAVGALVEQGASLLLQSLVLIGVTVILLSCAITLAQGGFYLATKNATPSMKKLNLLTGAKRLFGPQGWWEGGKALAKMAAVSAVLYFTMRHASSTLGTLPTFTSAVDTAFANAATLLRAAAATGLALAVVDYLVIRRRVGKQTRMSKEEVKQEYKHSEGDPHVKGRIRAQQRAMSRNRMLSDVAGASVVLTNPTHLAVALVYTPGSGAPRVVAKGAGHTATRIRDEAQRHHVPQVRDVPLARALYAATDVGQEIPHDLFTAVAFVLVYLTRRRHSGLPIAAIQDSPRPHLTDLPAHHLHAETPRGRKPRRSNTSRRTRDTQAGARTRTTT